MKTPKASSGSHPAAHSYSESFLCCWTLPPPTVGTVNYTLHAQCRPGTIIVYIDAFSLSSSFPSFPSSVNPPKSTKKQTNWRYKAEHFPCLFLECTSLLVIVVVIISLQFLYDQATFCWRNFYKNSDPGNRNSKLFKNIYIFIVIKVTWLKKHIYIVIQKYSIYWL